MWKALLKYNTGIIQVMPGYALAGGKNSKILLFFFLKNMFICLAFVECLM